MTVSLQLSRGDEARSGWGISLRDCASTAFLPLPLFLKVPYYSLTIQLSPSFFSVIEPVFSDREIELLYLGISSAMFGFLICTEACAGSKMCGNCFTYHLCVENCLLFGYVVERQWNNKSVVNKECCFALKYESFAVWWAQYHCKMLAGFVAAMEVAADEILTNPGLFPTHRQRGRWLWALHSVPPPWKHGQAAGADKVYEEGAASPLQGLQKCRSGCRIECRHWYKDINLQTNVVKVLSPLKFNAV